MNYAFLSISNLSDVIGCIIIQADNQFEAAAKLLPLIEELEIPRFTDVRGSILDEEGFKEQGMELNKFYTTEEMKKMGFKKDSEHICDDCKEKEEFSKKAHLN